MTTKQTAILRDIAFKYHPNLSKLSLTSQREILATANLCPKVYNAEHIVELSLAHIGGYSFVDQAYRDYNDVDNSDSKTGTVNINTRRVEVGGLENKIGAIRLLVWNPILDVLDYFFVPHDMWRFEGYSYKCHGKNKKDKLRFLFTWNSITNHYNKFEIFRLKDFVELATMTEDKFYNDNPTFASCRVGTGYDIETQIVLS